MNEELKDLFYYSLTFRDVLQHMAVSLLCAIMIALLYRITYKGLSYSSNFVNSIIMLTLVMTVVIMVIGNNLATAFGLVGAMSIIRFRTAVKDSQDIIFILFALAAGLASGVGLYEVAIMGTLIIGIVFYIIVNINYSTPRKRDFLLQLLTERSANESFDAGSILDQYCRRYQLVNVKAIGEDGKELMELSYYIKLKKENLGKDLVREIKNISGVKQVNLFYDEESA